MQIHSVCRLTSKLAPRLNTIGLWRKVGAFSYCIGRCEASMFRLGKLHYGYCKQQCCFLISCPGPSLILCTAKQISLPKSHFLSSISWNVTICVHLGHRDSSFKSCKMYLTSRCWEQDLSFEDNRSDSFFLLLRKINSGYYHYATGEGVENQAHKISSCGAYCSPRLRSKGPGRENRAFWSRVAESITELLLKWLREAI